MRQPYRAKLFLVGTLDKPQTRIIYNQIQNGDSNNDSNTSNNGATQLADNAQNQKELGRNPFNQVADSSYTAKNRAHGTSDRSQEEADKNGTTDIGEYAHLDKLAKAVAIAETSNCTKGYGVSHNNCFGIKKGNTYPCTTKKGSKMCNFATKEESFKAFKIIWAKWYKNPVPTMANANTWTGRDRAKTWLKHVKANL